MTVTEIIAIATPAAAAFGTPIGLGLRALAGSFRAVAKELKEIRIEFAEVRGAIGYGRKPRGKVDADAA